MKAYLDTEFSRFGGQLISLAIVTDDGEEFYGVLPLPSDMHPWVAEHVVPFLVKEAEPHHAFRARLATFLRRIAPGPIYADWPEDFVHLLQSICEPNGVMVKVELDLRLIASGDVKSVIPHNALSDARGLMHWHKLQEAA